MCQPMRAMPYHLSEFVCGLLDTIRRMWSVDSSKSGWMQSLPVLSFRSIQTRYGTAWCPLSWHSHWQRITDRPTATVGYFTCRLPSKRTVCLNTDHPPNITQLFAFRPNDEIILRIRLTVKYHLSKPKQWNIAFYSRLETKLYKICYCIFYLLPFERWHNAEFKLYLYA